MRILHASLALPPMARAELGSGRPLEGCCARPPCSSAVLPDEETVSCLLNNRFTQPSQSCNNYSREQAVCQRPVRCPSPGSAAFGTAAMGIGNVEKGGKCLKLRR